MARNLVLVLLLALALGHAKADAQTYRALAWPELLPPGEAELLVKQKTFLLQRAAPHGSLDESAATMADIQPGTFNTVKALNGTKVALKGFVVPLDFQSGKASTFLLVPYYGACIHAPPPPPNQTVLVRAPRAVALPALSAAVEARGVLEASTNASELGASAYLLRLDRINKIP
jgi:hypothetical protein